eukprot:gene21783-22752_t
MMRFDGCASRSGLSLSGPIPVGQAHRPERDRLRRAVAGSTMTIPTLALRSVSKRFDMTAALTD